MNDITKLPDKWRVDYAGSIFIRKGVAINLLCELEAALPKWTKITDDPMTLPNYCGTWVMTYSKYNGRISMGFADTDHVRSRPKMYKGISWRPLCDLDYPPEQKP